MLRRSMIWAGLVAAALSLAGRGDAAVTVFQDPTNAGTPGAGAVTVPINGGNVSLNLFYQTGNTPSPVRAGPSKP